MSKGYGDAVFRVEIDEAGLTARPFASIPFASIPSATFADEITLAQADSADRTAPIDTGWVVHACAFNGHPTRHTPLGSFPELTLEFQRLFDMFERRLCVRQLARSQAKYLARPHDRALEDRLLAKSERCGYFDAAAFSSFAFAYLVLGEARLDDSPNFTCLPPDTAPTDAVVEVQGVVRDAGLLKRGIDRYGPNWAD